MESNDAEVSFPCLANVLISQQIMLRIRSRSAGRLPDPRPVRFRILSDPIAAIRGSSSFEDPEPPTARFRDLAPNEAGSSRAPAGEGPPVHGVVHAHLQRGLASYTRPDSCKPWEHFGTVRESSRGTTEIHRNTSKYIEIPAPAVGFPEPCRLGGGSNLTTRSQRR